MTDFDNGHRRRGVIALETKRLPEKGARALLCAESVRLGTSIHDRSRLRLAMTKEVTEPLESQGCRTRQLGIPARAILIIDATCDIALFKLYVRYPPDIHRHWKI